MTKRNISLFAALVALAAGSIYFSASDTPILKKDPASASWTSFDDGIASAQQQQKKVIIDVYTDWCTWCKKMDADTYADGHVQRLLESRFVKIKLNAESDRTLTFNGKVMTEAQFAREAGVDGYPTTLFLDEQLKPITSIPGFVQPDRFTSILRFIGENRYQTMSFDAFMSKPNG